jgi:hypothetical protein
MSRRNDWRRVSRRERCPVCGRGDWCLLTGPTDAPEAAICPRVESPKRCGAAGWFHKLQDSGSRRPRRRAVAPGAGQRDRNLTPLMQRYTQAVTLEDLSLLGSILGVSAQSLIVLAVGWSREHGAWSFPMREYNGRVIGIRLRTPSGRKFSVRGGREGLFVPEALVGIGRGELPVCEDRPTWRLSWTSAFVQSGDRLAWAASNILSSWRERLRPPEIVIVADRDEPGQRGPTGRRRRCRPVVRW